MMDFDPDRPGCAAAIIILAAAGGTLVWAWVAYIVITTALGGIP